MHLNAHSFFGKRILPVLIIILVATGIHLAQEFRFYNIESNDLFLYAWADIWGRLQKTGGLATVLASFLTQFMRVPFAGAVILTGVYILVALLLYEILCRKSDNMAMAGFSLLPVAFLFLCMENDYYRFQGHMAFVLMLAALYAYVSIPKEKIRYIVGLALIPVLYHVAGSVALVFVVSASVWEITGNGLKGLKSLVYPVLLCVTAFIYVKASLVSSWEHALTPFMYYDWPSTYFFPIYAWATVPALIILSWLVSKVELKPSYVKMFAVFGVVVSFFVAGNLYSKVHSKSYYRLIQEQYWAEKGDWDQIIRTADRRQPTFFISYLNLALAQKGLLVQNFKYYNPQSLSGLMYPTPNLKTGLSLQSMVYSAFDYHAAARQAAFDANMVTSGNCNPRQIVVLARTNAALGAYDVADKYVRLLEKTLFYRGLAKDLRMSLGQKEPILPKPDEYVRYDGIKGDMRDIIEVDPDHPVLSQFYQLYEILEKEVQK